MKSVLQFIAVSSLGVLVGPFGVFSAQAQVNEIRHITDWTENARASVESGQSPQDDCALVAIEVERLLEEHGDSNDAVEAVEMAAEHCGILLPLAYFDLRLQAVNEEMASNPDNPLPCINFVKEFEIYYGVVSLPNSGQPANVRVKKELSEHAVEVCGFAAMMAGFR